MTEVSEGPTSVLAPAEVVVATWNTNGRSSDVIRDALTGTLLSSADVVVLTEVRQPPADHWGAADSIWLGTDPDRGVAVVTFNSYGVAALDPSTLEVSGHAVSVIDASDHRWLRWVVPAVVRHGASGWELKVLAVWADNSGNERPATQALTTYRDWLATGDVVVAGDFNHHRKWDHKNDNPLDHAHTVHGLANRGLQSTYHASRQTAERPDDRDEDAPTFWMYGHEDKPHHIDFVYAPVSWIRPDTVEIGSHHEFPGSARSDHAAVVARLAPTGHR